MATIGSVARWWIDLRDPWAGPMETVWQSHWRLGTRVFRTIAPLLERLAFRAADGVITNTTQLADVLAAKYRDVPFVSVPNGVDPEHLPPPAHPRYPGVGLAYVGKLYAGRDLRPVVLALRTFLERHPEAAAAGSKLRVAGAADPRNAEAFTRAVAAAGLEQQVEALGVLSHAEALNVVSRSRLVVVLAQEQELQIPAKLYESVAMRVPTLVVAPPDSAAGMEGKRLGALVCDSNDVAGIAGVLEQLWRDGVRDQPPCPVPITYDAIAHFVDRVLLMGAPGALTRQAAAASV
jgi:glycosyltransferase involved in cell wall biosynthesis